MMYDVIVIGGGAAGMLAAVTAAGRGLRVLLLEHSEYTGKKLGITGKGRCNLTNNCTARAVLEHIPTGARFLQGAIYGFTPQDTMRLFESFGVALKTERGGRVFPVSDKARDVVAALRRRLNAQKVTVKRLSADTLEIADGVITGVRAGEQRFACRGAILCTGGVSYPLTGSTGDGYRMAQAAGHTIVTPKPSLVPLGVAGTDCPRMQGLALRNVRLTVRDGSKKPVFDDFGELLFTHFGISGPLTLSASAHMRDFAGKTYTASIDLKPALDEKALDARLLRDFAEHANRDFINILGGLVNRMMVPIMAERSGIPPETKVHSVTREQRQGLLRLLKRFDLEITGPRPVAEAIVTSGGVDTKEIHPKTMESRLVSGLHFAGEIIDADAYTGGFNLQIAWSTAHAAATHILTEKD